MKDFYYPLPKKKLIERYKTLFDVIKKRQSGCFIGLPQSAKSGYLRFLLEEKKIIRKLLPSWDKTHKVLYFEPIPLITNNPYHWLFQLSIKLASFDNRYLHIKTKDPSIILTNIQEYILRLDKNKEHLTIILAKANVWERLTKEAGYALRAIWDTARKPPHNPCSFIFLLYSKSPSLDSLSEFYKPLDPVLNENLMYFRTLDKSETAYTIDRLASFYNLKITQSIKKRIFELTGGYYRLIQNTINILNAIKTEKFSLKLIQELGKDKVNLNDIGIFWESLTEGQKTELIKSVKGASNNVKSNSTLIKIGILTKENKICSEWINRYILEKRYAKTFEDIEVIKNLFKGKEYFVLTYFLKKESEVVTRDEIARILWGNKENEKYSNWAIDKTVSRIRHKLAANNTACSIITIKKQGYVLLK